MAFISINKNGKFHCFLEGEDLFEINKKLDDYKKKYKIINMGLFGKIIKESRWSITNKIKILKVQNEK